MILTDNEIADLVTTLANIAKAYGNDDYIRQRISNELAPKLKRDMVERQTLAIAPTPEQLAQWREEAKKVWTEQGRAHWVNMSDFDNYAAGYICACTEQAAHPRAPRKPITADDVTDEMIAVVKKSTPMQGVVTSERIAAAYNAVNKLRGEAK